MKNKILAAAFVLLFSNSFAQEQPFIIGAEGSYFMPFGGMSERFEPSNGFSLYFGQQISENWSWIGKIEYFKYDETNSDKLVKSFTAEVGDNNQYFEVPLKDLEMEFSAYGAAFEARYNLLRVSKVETNLNFAFGFYKYENYRSEYRDSVSIDTSGAGDMLTVWSFDVPPLSRTEWSGVLSLGVDFSFGFFDPVWIDFSARYKMVVAELWPALDLDLESVSGIQNLQLSAGIFVKL